MSLTNKNYTASANTAASTSVSGQTDRVMRGNQVSWSYSNTPTNGKLTISSSGGTVLLEHDITAGGPGFLDLDGYNSLPGEGMSAVLAAGGSGVVGKISLAVDPI